MRRLIGRLLCLLGLHDWAYVGSEVMSLQWRECIRPGCRAKGWTRPYYGCGDYFFRRR